MNITNDELALRATRTLALLKEATVISKKDGSKLTEDERFFVFLCGYWYFASLINDAGGRDINYEIHIEIVENSSHNGARGNVTMRLFVDGVSSYVQYLLSTFSPRLQEKYNDFCINHDFSKYPTLLDDIESYSSGVDFDWLVETHYRDYICLDPMKDKITSHASPVKNKDVASNNNSQFDCELILRAINDSIKKFQGPQFDDDTFKAIVNNIRLPGPIDIWDSLNELDKILTLLQETKEPLFCIKRDMSKDFYEIKSTRIASLAMNKTMEVLDEYQKGHGLLFFKKMHLSAEDKQRLMLSNSDFKSLLKKSLEVITLIDKMDKDSIFEQNYSQNRQRLRELCVIWGVINDDSSKNNGCWCLLSLLIIPLSIILMISL